MFFFVYVDIESGSTVLRSQSQNRKEPEHFGGDGAVTRCSSCSDGFDSKLYVQSQFQFKKSKRKLLTFLWLKKVGLLFAGNRVGAEA
jgi:hypothetical protein